MTEPERDDKAEQQTTPQENKQESKQLLKRQWDEVLTRNKHIFAPVNTCLLFVTALAAVGLNAYYGGHHIALNIISALCVLLLLALLSVVIWYLRPLPTRTTTQKSAPSKQSRWQRFTQSSIGKRWLSASNSLIVRLLTIACYIFNVVSAVRTFPEHPRGSLTTIVICLAGGMVLAIFWVADSLQKQISRLWDSHDRIVDILDTHTEIMKSMSGDTRALGEIFHQYVKDMSELMPIQLEADAATSAAIRAIHNSVLALAEQINPKEPPSECDQEPPKIGT
jgi:hypothetical protein